MKRFFLYLIFILIIITTLLLLTEAAFRFFRQEPLTELAVATTQTDYRNPRPFEANKTWESHSSIPGEFSVMCKSNSHGLRGPDFPKEKSPGKTRVLMVGDSFTFGVGAEENETVPFQTEKKLKAMGYSVETINAGVGHTGPAEQYVRMRDYYLQFEPDVVLFLFDFSDLKNDWSYEKRAVYDETGKILYQDPFVLYGKTDRWAIMIHNSSFCRWLHRKVVRPILEIKVLGLGTWAKGMLKGKRSKAMIANKIGDTADSNIDTINYDLYLLIRGRQMLPQIQKHWQRTGGYLLKMRDLCKTNNIPFMIVLYPYGIHVGPNQWNEGRVFWGFQQGKTYTDRYAFDFIETFARLNEIPIHNSLDDFLANKDTGLFFPFDGHMTPAGYETLAASIVKNKGFLSLLQKA